VIIWRLTFILWSYYCTTIYVQHLLCIGPRKLHTATNSALTASVNEIMVCTHMYTSHDDIVILHMRFMSQFRRSGCSGPTIWGCSSANENKSSPTAETPACFLLVQHTVHCMQHASPFRKKNIIQYKNKYKQ
jgi:hypothetical protein